uniref:Uncharacterized protein n=1 Tax=Glossina brevipalpis TaxID=37001 RepID=A0A1A9WS50_9MUSC
MHATRTLGATDEVSGEVSSTGKVSGEVSSTDEVSGEVSGADKVSGKVSSSTGKVSGLVVVLLKFLERFYKLTKNKVFEEHNRPLKSWYGLDKIIRGLDALVNELKSGGVTLRRHRRQTRANEALQEMFQVLEISQQQNRQSTICINMNSS